MIHWNICCPSIILIDWLKVNEVELFLQHVDDIGGIKAAHLAYQKRFGKYESNLVLPGFEELSPEQLFFLSYANVSEIFYPMNFIFYVTGLLVLKAIPT